MTKKGIYFSFYFNMNSIIIHVFGNISSVFAGADKVSFFSSKVEKRESL